MKNLLLAILSIGLAISLYFNYRDSKKLKIDTGKDALKITFYGINKIKDSMAGSPPIPAELEKGGTVMVYPSNCDQTLTLGKPCNNVKEYVKPGPGVHPTVDEILLFILQKYKGITI